MRLDPTLRKELLEFISRNKDVAPSEKFVVTCLIEAFLKDPEDERRAFLRNPKSLRHFIELLDKAVLRSSMADHAFVRRHWSWAIQEYGVLEELSTGELGGVGNLAVYKQGYCWLDLAIELRTEGLLLEDVSAAAQFHSAARSCFVSLEYLKRFDGGHPAIEFTKACAWSLAAQFSVETHLAHAPEAMRALRARRPPQDKEDWNEPLFDWRKYVGSDVGTLEKLLGECVEGTISALDALRKHAANDPSFHALESFLIARSSTDPDLKFLREDEATSAAFTRWQRNNTDSESSISKQFASLYQALPSDIQEAVDPRG